MLLGCICGVALLQLLRKAPLGLGRRRNWVRCNGWLLANVLLLILVCCPGVEGVQGGWGLGSLRRPEGHRQRVVRQQFVGAGGRSDRKRRGRRRRRSAMAMVSSGMVVDLLTRVCTLLLVFVPPQVPCPEQLLNSIAALIPARSRDSTQP